MLLYEYDTFYPYFTPGSAIYRSELIHYNDYTLSANVSDQLNELIIIINIKFHTRNKRSLFLPKTKQVSINLFFSEGF